MENVNNRSKCCALGSLLPHVTMGLYANTWQNRFHQWRAATTAMLRYAFLFILKWTSLADAPRIRSVRFIEGTGTNIKRFNEFPPDKLVWVNWWSPYLSAIQVGSGAYFSLDAVFRTVYSKCLGTRMLARTSIMLIQSAGWSSLWATSCRTNRSSRITSLILSSEISLAWLAGERVARVWPLTFECWWKQMNREF